MNDAPLDAAVSRRVGFLLGTFIGPDQLAPIAKRVEDGGFDELWLAEDCFFTGGISAITGVLAATRQIPVSTGIVSGLVRHPAVLAMELSTVAGMFPGRMQCGVGLGHPPWLRQMGLYPRSPLTAMQECVTGLRELLAGRTVTRRGEYFAFDDVTLRYPPPATVPILMGAVGPRMLELAGRIADGHVVPLTASTAYVEWARARIQAGAESVGRARTGPVSVFVLFSVDQDGDRARERIRDLLAYYLLEALSIPALLEPHGCLPALRALAEEGGQPAVRRGLPEEWLRDFAVAGAPDECAALIRAYFDAGADSVVLFPVPAERSAQMVDAAVTEILPRLADLRATG